MSKMQEEEEEKVEKMTVCKMKMATASKSFKMVKLKSDLR